MSGAIRLVRWIGHLVTVSRIGATFKCTVFTTRCHFFWLLRAIKTSSRSVSRFLLLLQKLLTLIGNSSVYCSFCTKVDYGLDTHWRIALFTAVCRSVYETRQSYWGREVFSKSCSWKYGQVLHQNRVIRLFLFYFIYLVTAGCLLFIVQELIIFTRNNVNNSSVNVMKWHKTKIFGITSAWNTDYSR